MNKPTKSSLRVYGAGGAGINTVQNLNLPIDAAGFPNTFFGLIDTSKSNISLKPNKTYDTFVVPGVDGTGKNRQFAHQISATHLNDMLLTCPPKEFNIVVFGLSGGSGSVLGPLLIEELSKRGQSVIGICISSIASQAEAQNAYNTLGTLQNIAVNRLKKPVVCCIHENCVTTPRHVVDGLIEANIRAIAMLVSGTNLELDKKDINNWLNYDKVTKITPQLVDLIVYLSGKDTNSLADLSAISVANLLPSKEDTEVTLGQLYSCVGYCSEGATGASSHEIPPMHFIISNQFMADRILKLKTTVEQYKQSEAELHAVKIPEFDNGDESGFIF